MAGWDKEKFPEGCEVAFTSESRWGKKYLRGVVDLAGYPKCDTNQYIPIRITEYSEDCNRRKVHGGFVPGTVIRAEKING